MRQPIKGLVGGAFHQFLRVRLPSTVELDERDQLDEAVTGEIADRQRVLQLVSVGEEIVVGHLQPGEAVSLRVVDGKRGRMAMQVTSWESALKPDE